LPCAVFVWSIENNGAEPLDVSITFTFKNGQGEEAGGDDVAGGVWNEEFCNSGEDCPLPSAESERVSGVLIHQTLGGMQCTCAVAARLSVISVIYFLMQ